jgi:hypothetical protein
MYALPDDKQSVLIQVFNVNIFKKPGFGGLILPFLKLSVAEPK